MGEMAVVRYLQIRGRWARLHLQIRVCVRRDEESDTEKGDLCVT